MHVFIWTYVDPITSSWHSGGGVLIVAESLEAAKVIWLDSEDAKSVTRNGGDPATVLVDAPDHTLPTGSTEPLLVLFPDAGCC